MTEREILNESQIEEALRSLNGEGDACWELAGSSLSRAFEFEDFRQAFAFMTQVAELAERLDHHPDWENSYSRVGIRLTTHSAGGLTRLDFQMAQGIDALLSEGLPFDSPG